MANEEQLSILKQGVDIWNLWRKQKEDLLTHLDLTGANLIGANLTGANLNEANLKQAFLTRASLSSVDLTDALLWEVVLSEADLSGAVLRRTDFWRANLWKVNLAGADLSGANLWEATLKEAVLKETNLGEAALRKANLTEANLMGADLTRADLTGADLSGANLQGAKLREAKLDLVSFNGTYLGMVDLSNARMSKCLFGNLDLSIAKGLETIYHSGPSTLGIDTIYRSGGCLPLAFLRGCGLSDIQIEMVKLHRSDLSVEQITSILYHIHSLRVDGAIQYHSSFISYAHQDQFFADVLYRDLQENGVRCWFAPEDLRIGEKFRIGIDESIRMHDKLLLILSEHSVTSHWVEQEVETALAKEQETREPVLFPIRLDDAIMKVKTGWPALIKNTRHIGNFCQWKNQDKYQKAFEILLRDLKAASPNGVLGDVG